MTGKFEFVNPEGVVVVFAFDHVSDHPDDITRFSPPVTGVPSISYRN